MAVGMASEVAARASRGLALWTERRHEMEAAGDGSWLVPSGTHPGEAHRVDPAEGTCSCGDHGYHPEYRCKHAWMVDLELALIETLSLTHPEYAEANDVGASRGSMGRRLR